jgi:hypothetical protein
VGAGARQEALVSAVLSALRRERWTYLWINVAYYGLVGIGIAWAGLNRPLQDRLLTVVAGELTMGSLAPVSEVYAEGGILLAAVVTFGVNLIVGSLAAITLPSLVVPFSGLVLAAVRAVMWGLLFAPPTLDVGVGSPVAGASIAIVLLLEGQGYVLTALAAVVQGRAVLWPGSVGARSWRHGFAIGVRQAVTIYGAVVVVLAIAAMVEALAVIALMPALGLGE